MTEGTPLTIAIDGFSSCGKSTIAKELAAKLHYVFIDSGAMYRAVTLHFLRNKWIENQQLKPIDVNLAMDEIDVYFQFNQLTSSSDVYLNGENVEKEIRLPLIAENVSKVAAIPAVREKMVALQRAMGEGGGVVMDGRDIGTVVFPDADLKIFVTADTDVRAQRRFKELSEKGELVNLASVKQNLLERDRLDSTREVAPLKKAEDAHELDTTYLTQDEQLHKVMSMVEQLTCAKE
jgi:cytidylate kinase